MINEGAKIGKISVTFSFLLRFPSGMARRFVLSNAAVGLSYYGSQLYTCGCHGVTALQPPNKTP